MNFHDAMQLMVHVFEVTGVAIFAVGGLISAYRAWRTFGRDRSTVYEGLRQDVGRSILLGLEVLIVADIVQTIILDLTIETAVSLGIVVLVRTFLSFSLEVELNGEVPWRAAANRLRSRGGSSGTAGSQAS